VSRRANAYVVTGLLSLGSALLIPQLGWASSGGAGLGGGGTAKTTASPAPSSPKTTGVVQRANQSVSTSGNGITLTTRESAMLRRGLHFTGTVPSSSAGKIVEIERRGQQTHNAWAPTAHGTVASDGSFSAYWPANHIGQFAVRAVIEDHAGSARAAAPSPSVTTFVFRPSIATWYGDGSWGSKTACGVTLRRTTLGTANRTLPCGTRVAVYYGGKMIIVPVIDRGPYANHADWDLTLATSQKLGTPGIAHIGAASLPSR
jgi:peptidoglycan lytic transglycosylase